MAVLLYSIDDFSISYSMLYAYVFFGSSVASCIILPLTEVGSWASEQT